MPLKSGQFSASEPASKWLGFGPFFFCQGLQSLLGIAEGLQTGFSSSDLAGNFRCHLHEGSVDPHQAKFNAVLEESVMSLASGFPFCVSLHLYDSDLTRLLDNVRQLHLRRLNFDSHRKVDLH